MDRVCFFIGNWPIYWYGVLMAAAFMACMLHLTALGRRAGYPPDFGADLTLWLMLAGVLGARLAYVIANAGEFARHPLDIARIDQGGLVFYGGFIGACLVFIGFARRHRQPLWGLADYAVTALPLGHAIGRLGCFLNGCCFGAASDVPWAVWVEGARRHPTPLYETGWNLIVYAVLLTAYFRRPRPGRVFALYLLVYPVGRFLMEGVRGDERLRWLGLTVAQEVSVALILTGLALWRLLPKADSARDSIESRAVNVER